MRARSFLVFVGIFVFVIITLGLSFHLAFGVSNYSMRGFGESIITMFRMLFGDFDYESLENENRVLGPVLFLFFFLFLGLILMNIFIAVMSEVYINAQKENEASWEIYITSLLVIHIQFNGIDTTWDYFVHKLKIFWEFIRPKPTAEDSDIALVEVGEVGERRKTFGNHEDQDVGLLGVNDFIAGSIGALGITHLKKLQDDEAVVVMTERQIDKLSAHMQSIRAEESNANSAISEEIKILREESKFLRDEVAELKGLILALSAGSVQKTK